MFIYIYILLLFTDDQTPQIQNDKGTQTGIETGQKTKYVICEFQNIFVVIYKKKIKSKQNNLLMKQSFLFQTKEKKSTLANKYDRTIVNCKRKHINILFFI